MSEQEQMDITRQVTNIVVNHLLQSSLLMENLQDMPTRVTKVALINGYMQSMLSGKQLKPVIFDIVMLAKDYIDYGEVYRRLEAGQ